MKSLKESLLEHIRLSNGWVRSPDLERVSQELGYTGSNGLRRCRELKAAGKLERRINGKIVEYKFRSINIPGFEGTMETLDSLIDTARKLRADREINLTIF